MPRVWRVALLVVVCLIAAPGVPDVAAQQFGRNKVEYVDFDFKVLRSEHFEIYYYSSEEKGARLAARLAERWHARLSEVLGHTISSRQPLILYGSHPEFAQTNVVGSFLGEGIGGVTESARRRIVMPFAPTLAETDHVLGHEIAHAFQFDMTRQNGGALSWPLWAVEGMAEYLSVGMADVETRMWLRDAVVSDLLPQRQQQAAQAFSPYRYGAAMWAYLAGRFGDGVMGQVLKARGGGIERRLLKVTGVAMNQLFSDWRAAALEQHGGAGRSQDSPGATPLLRGLRRGRLHLGPSLSPDGSEAIFFSERDRLSLDLFLAETRTGTVTRKLATTSGTARYESLQAIRSSGSWNAQGDRFVFAAIEQGEPSLVLLNTRTGAREKTITLPQFGQIFTPAWSADGRSIAFSGLEGGFTDLFIYDLLTGSVRRLTDDPYADLQPTWSADGRTLAFITDRFSTDLKELSFGPTSLALVDVASAMVSVVAGMADAKHVNPQWSGDGASLYFLSDPDGVSNVYRVEIASGALHQVSDVSGGVTGLASTSPAMSVARDAAVMAYTTYRRGAYEVQIVRDASLGGTRLAGAEPSSDVPAVSASAEGLLQTLLADHAFGLPTADSVESRAYVPSMSLESIGQPYLSSGGGPLGTFVRGGGSLLFGDVLGERKLITSVQVGNRLRDLAFGVGYLNRERRWNWGASAELQPSIRRLPRREFVEQDGQSGINYRTHYFERMQMRLDGLLAYPLNQGLRFEIDGGVRHITYKQSVHSTTRSLETARVIERSTTEVFGGLPTTIGEASTALVGDTAVVGPTGPILGSRYRFEVASAFGDLTFNRVLLDYRRYEMPVKPYTIAARMVHLGHYGRDADDPRILPTFLGSRQFVRGYGWNALACGSVVDGNCDAFEDLLGSRLAVSNLEVRVPVMGILSRDITYGPIPAEAFLFADNGLVWGRSPTFAPTAKARRWVSSVGAGVRVNAFGFPVELAAVRAMSAPARGWSFDFSIRPAF